MVKTLLSLACLSVVANSAVAAPYNRTLAITESGSTVASAALLTPWLALTANHAVPATPDDGGYAVTVMRCGEQLIAGVVTKRLAIVDLALVELAQQCTSVDVTPLADANAEEGASLAWQGYPNGGPRKVMRGTAAGYQVEEYGPNDHRFVLIVDGRMIPGHSGGPVLNDSGLLVGIVSGTLCFGGKVPGGMPAQCVGIVVPLSVIKAFIAIKGWK